MAFFAQAAETLTMLAVQVLISLVLAGGIAKCWSISRRPGTNTKCVMALMLLLIACLIPFVSRTLSAIVPIPFPLIIALCEFAIILAAGVLAVIGLREYSRGRYVQGKAQAIWALTLSGIVAILPLALLAQLKWNFLSTGGTATAGRVVTREDLNFKFFVPGHRWHEAESDPLDLKPVLALRCTGSDLQFAVVAQPASTHKQSSEQLEILATNTLSKALDDLRILSRAAIQKDTLEGIQLDIEAGHRGQPLYVENRLFDGNGFIYQLIAWGPKRYESTVMEQAQALLHRFELIDYNRPLYRSVTNFMEPVTKPQQPISAPAF